jgi:hypothetical protein
MESCQRVEGRGRNRWGGKLGLAPVSIFGADFFPFESIYQSIKTVVYVLGSGVGWFDRGSFNLPRYESSKKHLFAQTCFYLFVFISLFLSHLIVLISSLILTLLPLRNFWEICVEFCQPPTLMRTQPPAEDLESLLFVPVVLIAQSPSFFICFQPITKWYKIKHVTPTLLTQSCNSKLFQNRLRSSEAPKLQSMNTVELQKCLHWMMSYHYSHRCWCTLSVPADHIVIGTQLTIETLRFVNLLELKFAVNTK